MKVFYGATKASEQSLTLKPVKISTRPRVTKHGGATKQATGEKIVVHSFTDKGKRKTNQDYIAAVRLNSEKSVYIVTDGMGGYDHGDVASKGIAESVITYISGIENVSPHEIQKAVNKANLFVRQKIEDFKTKLGATIGGVVTKKNVAHVFWVGDVKIAVIRNYEIVFESKSHTLINEMIQNGNTISNIDKYRHIVNKIPFRNCERRQN